MRLVRSYRKRSKILKFEGGYHGMSDYGLLSLWPTKAANSARPLPDSAGIPASVQEEVIVAPYNDLKATQDLISEHKDELAGVIVEPMQRLIPPIPGFLQGLRSITAEYGIPLIFDEVVTGFRLAYGGGQEFYGVTPDVCTLGKIVGGGYPLSAVAGKAEIMAHFDKAKVGAEGFMPQLGTLSGNPIAAVAGLITLKILKRPGAFDRLHSIGGAIRKGLEQGLLKAGLPHVVKGENPMFDVLFTDRPKVENYRDQLTANDNMNRRFNQLLRERGLLKGNGKFYISLAHDDEDIKQTIDAIHQAAEIVAKEMSDKADATRLPATA
jgi:glutamate-1-semialdehyde 2,1-aminomutase